MVKANKIKKFTGRELTAPELKELLMKTGRLLKAAREERTTLEKFVHEIKVDKTQMIKHERGGNMLFSTFLKLMHGLDINPEEFFRELQNPGK